MIERRRDLIVEKYNILSETVLMDNTVFSEKDRIRYHDFLGNKISEICHFVTKVDRENNNCTLKKQIIKLEKEILASMGEIKDKVGGILDHLSLEDIDEKCKDLEDVKDDCFSKVEKFTLF